MIATIAASLYAVGNDAGAVDGPSAPESRAELPEPTTAQIRRSIRDDGLVGFEDGRSDKTLKRHFLTHGLTPETYRLKWGLPADYPMTGPAYSAQRSAMAKPRGLAQKGRGAGKARAGKRSTR